MRRLRSVVSSLLLALCSAGVTQAADLEKSSIRLAVGGKTLVAYLPLTIADQRGFFTIEWRDVEISDCQGGG